MTFDFTPEEVETLLEALDAFEQRAKSEAGLSALFGALLLGPPRSEDEKLKREFFETEKKQEAAAQARSAQRRSAMVRMKLLTA